MSVAAQSMTAEEFAALPRSELRRELVYGEVVETMPPGGIHGVVAGFVYAFLLQWVRQNGGFAGVESGFFLARDPDLVRSPDAYYVRAERVPEDGIPEGFWPLAPDLAVEIVSPNDGAEEIEQKVNEYLTAGSAAVWVVYPRLRRLAIHTPDGIARAYAAADTITNPAPFDGVSLVLQELFP